MFSVTSTAECIETGYLLPEVPRPGSMGKAANGLRVGMETKKPLPPLPQEQ
jgi:hypothetical protein